MGEDVSRTFVRREHNREISVDPVSNIFNRRVERADQNIHILADVALRMCFDNFFNRCARVELLTGCHCDGFRK